MYIHSIYITNSSVFFQGEIGDQNVAMAIADPKKFVMKPQLEGGGMYDYCCHGLR